MSGRERFLLTWCVPVVVALYLCCLVAGCPVGGVPGTGRGQSTAATPPAIA